MPKLKRAPDTLLVDLDGTTYSYPEYAVFTFRAMMHALVTATGKDEEAVVDSMRKHYSLHGIESPYLVEALRADGFFAETRMSDEQWHVLRRNVRHAFNAAKANHLKPYPGILEVLEDAQRSGKDVIALTDATELATSSKLNAHRTKLIDSRHFSRLIALDGSTQSTWVRQKEKVTKEEHRLRERLKIPVTITPKEKPHSELEKLLNLSRDEIRQRVGILGDNFNRDMALARSYGMRGYHALWGVVDLKAHEAELARFSGGTGPVTRSLLPRYYPKDVHPVATPEMLYGLWDLPPKKQ